MSSDLVRRVRQVLADAEMLSEGSTQSWNKSSPNADQDHSPKGERSLSDALCATLTAWVGKAEVQVQSIKTAPQITPESVEDFRARLIREHAGLNYREVAVRENVSVAYVRKIREEAGRDPKEGKRAA